MNPDYNQLFTDAVEIFLFDYTSNKVRLYSERDLQSHLFYHIRKLMQEQGFPTPFQVYAEKRVFGREKVDLVLGDNEVLVELKLEPDYPGVSKPVVFTTLRDAGGRGSGSIEYDIDKIQRYCDQGRSSHLLVIDEDGLHKRKLKREWRAIKHRGKDRYLLHIQLYPEMEKSK